jgi:Golgi CORVET complex core vacuolar protein 8
VVTLCRTHRLFGALVYVYTHEDLDDYLTPLDDMCKAMLAAHPPSSPASSSANSGAGIAAEVGCR